MTMSIIWAVIGVLSAIVEICTVAVVAIWFLGGAVAALIVSLVGGPIWLQIVLFIGISIAGFILFNKFWREKMKGRTTPTNLDRLVGKNALTTEIIDNLRQSGAVTFNGQHWNARAKSDDVVIPEGERVRICKFEGSKVIVEPATTGSTTANT